MTRLLDIELNITYGCNRACRYCERLLDVQPIRRADLTTVQRREFVACLLASGLRFGRVKLAGGEPTTHPRFGALVTILRRLVRFSPRGRVARRLLVMTNGVNGTPTWRGVRYCVDPPESKRHEPFLISPRDAGLEPRYGVDRRCPITLRCGVAFDAFGFTPCTVASVIGRLAGVDPYSREPVWRGRPEHCRHCIYSVRTSDRAEMRRMCRAGELPYPSPTMTEALRRLRDHPPTFPRWRFQP